MIHKGFKMKLYDGMAEEYEKRHNELWPEMKDMIHEYGGKNYTIFLDKETLTLFGYIEIEDEERWAQSFSRMHLIIFLIDLVSGLSQTGQTDLKLIMPVDRDIFSLKHPEIIVIYCHGKGL